MARLRVSKKTTVTAIALSVIIAGPVGLAVAHPGFPTSDVDLFARNVWVTNGSVALAGQINLQIKELNASLSVSDDLEVLQQGDSIFVHDRAGNTVGKVDTAVQRVPSSIELEPGVTLALGGGVLAATEPVHGRVWVLDAAGEITGTLSPDSAHEFGSGTQTVVSVNGIVYIVSASQKAAYRIANPGAGPEKLFDMSLDDFTLTTVGDRLVILHRLDTRNDLIVEGRVRHSMPSGPMRLQQPGSASDVVVLASGAGLLFAPLGGGELQERSSEPAEPSSHISQFAAPVVVGDCAHGAWASSARYFVVCGGGDGVTEVRDLPEVTVAEELVFRVNRNDIVLNSVTSGAVWLVTEDMTVILIDAWLEVAPPLEDDDAPESDDTTTQPSFDEVLKERPETNTPPEPKNDEFGIRADRTTVLPVLDNDLDPDGDVLTILSVTGSMDGFARLDVIDQGRALQISPETTASGTRTFAYTVTDGRPGGVAQAVVTVTVTPASDNRPPEPVRSSQVSIEAAKTISYNVLTDWRDPDGDDVYLTSAVSTAGDTVRYAPDGTITFTHTVGEPGVRSVIFTVSDGRVDVAGQPQGELLVKVEPGGTLLPLTVPDFASTFTHREIVVSPLVNDVSLSNAELFLVLVEPLTSGAAWSLDPERGQVRVSASDPGSYYFVYTASAGAGKESRGLIRVDVAPDPDEPLPPVAVKDTAFLRPSEPLTVAVLANDVSPSGAVLGVQSVSVPTAGAQRGLTVEILGSTYLRITSQGALTEPISIGYTISDGRFSSSSSVTVVPIPELTRHQAPIARDDRVTIRVGDVASVSVLANDFHPDGALMRLSRDLIQGFEGGDGVAFVEGDLVRIQAPSEPGVSPLVYRVDDAHSEYATARVVLTVLGIDEESNRAPVPQPITARVLAGSDLTVEIPMNGIDPDGDSTILLSVSGAQRGQVLDTTLTSFQYRASRDGGGTEVLHYVVEDAFGARGTGEVRIGIIPPPDSALPPTAVDDVAQVRPGSTVAVRVMDNDSDPANSPLRLRPALLEVQEGITAVVDDRLVLVTAGEQEGTFVVRYEIENAQGGTDDAFITVTVTADAVPQSPIAIDHVLTVADIVGLQTVDIDLLAGAFNPDGPVDELEITFDGSGVGAVDDLLARTATITLIDRRQAIAYTLTSPETGLSATAFVVVPSATSALPPYVKPEVERNPPILVVGRTTTLQIRDLVEVPSGGPLTIMSTTVESATRGLGAVTELSQTEVRITPQEEHRGDAQSVSLLVTDGITDGGAGTLVTIPLIVGDPESRDVAPLFTTIALPIEADGSTSERDLRLAVSHPNSRIVEDLSFTATISGATGSVRVSVSGGVLSASAPLGGAMPGDEVVVDLVIDSEQLLTDAVVGRVVITVVPSTRPLPQANEDSEPDGRSNSSYTVAALANDFNPFAAIGGSLRIVDAVFDGDPMGASLGHTSSDVTVTTGPAKSGTISVIYTVEDETNEPSRRVQGRITVIVTSAPESPSFQGSPQRGGSGTLVVTFNPPSSWNGSSEVPPAYVVRAYIANSNVLAATRTDCYAGAACSFADLSNGVGYYFVVTAQNAVGATASSNSAVNVPYGVPSAPRSVTLEANKYTATASLSANWSSPSDRGGGSTGSQTLWYDWRYVQGSSASSTSPVYSTSGANLSVGAGTYRVEVRACNPVGCSHFSGSWESSNPVHITDPPPPRILDAVKGPVAPGACPTTSDTCLRIRLLVENLSGTHTVCFYGRLAGSNEAYGVWAGRGCTPTTFSGGAANTEWLLNSVGNVRVWEIRVTINGVPDFYDTIWP